MTSEYFHSYTVRDGKEKQLHEVCTITGRTCIREGHNCGECDTGRIAQRWEAKYGKAIPDPATSSKSARKRH